MRRIVVTASTMAEANPSQVTASRPYRWRKKPDWTPNDPRYRENTPAGLVPGSGGAVNTSRRTARLAGFTAALAALGYPDPVNAPDRAVIEAGKRVGVGEKTAKSYRTALKQQRREQEGEPGC